MLSKTSAGPELWHSSGASGRCTTIDVYSPGLRLCACSALWSALRRHVRRSADCTGHLSGDRSGLSRTYVSESESREHERDGHEVHRVLLPSCSWTWSSRRGPAAPGPRRRFYAGEGAKDRELTEIGGRDPLRHRRSRASPL